jgi:hypothetical protein
MDIRLLGDDELRVKPMPFENKKAKRRALL